MLGMKNGKGSSFLVFVLAAATLLAPAVAWPEAIEPADAPYPKILLPQDGEWPPEGEDKHDCAEAGPCYKLEVRGKVPEDLWPFLAVALHNVAPRIWIQPPIAAKRRDGSFDGIVYLGTDEVGAGEWYSIFILAHPNEKRFEEGDVLTELPEDCVVSDPVTVLRRR